MNTDVLVKIIIIIIHDTMPKNFHVDKLAKV